MSTNDRADSGAAPEVRRHAAIVVRCTPEEHERIKRRAAALGVSIARLVREAALGERAP